ncbi:phage major capsid protein [Paremcibacter congregatus]|uniref:phage major capsid protein n=1 Tax=Paremcibacter congregatus TaxID=2043170 RepID=UPI0030EE8DC8|tara:strand:- start:7346 stop:8605 length:1260 start_codon:yes stop_codon:yes gene_type:complete
MTIHENLRKRGLASVRADASEPSKILSELNTTFAAFKEANEERIKGVESKFDDVVTNDKVDRINAEVTSLQKAIDEVNAMMAAQKMGSGQEADPVRSEHAKAFDTFFRKGPEAGLKELEVKASLSTQSDPDGGFVVPEQMEGQIDRVMTTVSAMRGLSRVMSISAPVYKRLITTSGAASGWVEEQDARTETNTPKLSALEFPVKELYANPAASQTMLDDATISIEQWLAEEVSIEFAEQEASAFINGDGVGKPRGILGYDKVANASYAWGKTGFVTSGAAAAFATTSPDNALISLQHSLKQGYRNNASFLMADSTIEEVRKFKDANKLPLWQPSTQLGAPSLLLGKPVYTDDNMPIVGANAFAVAFGDFQRAYLIIDRVGIRVLRDPYTNKPNVSFYTTKRVGGGIQNFEAIKLLKIAA